MRQVTAPTLAGILTTATMLSTLLINEWLPLIIITYGGSLYALGILDCKLNKPSNQARKTTNKRERRMRGELLFHSQNDKTPAWAGDDPPADLCGKWIGFRLACDHDPDPDEQAAEIKRLNDRRREYKDEIAELHKIRSEQAATIEALREKGDSLRRVRDSYERQD